MTPDIKKLVKRCAHLIEQYEDDEVEFPRDTLSDCIDALEALAGEVATLTEKNEALAKALSKTDRAARDFFAKADAITKEADQELEDLHDALKVVLARAKAAEAERDRLAGEVERLQSLVVETSAKAGAAIGSCEVLADAMARKDEDVAEVTAERDELANWKASFLHENEQILASNEQLAAERDRLKAALDEAVKWMDGCAVSGGYPTWHAKARKALGGDA